MLPARISERSSLVGVAQRRSTMTKTPIQNAMKASMQMSKNAPPSSVKQARRRTNDC